MRCTAWSLQLRSLTNHTTRTHPAAANSDTTTNTSPKTNGVAKPLTLLAEGSSFPWSSRELPLSFKPQIAGRYRFWWLAHHEFLGRRPVLHSCTRTRSGQVLPALRAAIGAVLRPLLSFPLLLCRSSASPPHASQPRQRPSSPSRVWLEGESPSLSIKVLALFSAGFYPLTRRRKRQPLSASAIGAALHFPSASALEARTPDSRQRPFLPKPRSAKRGVTLSFKVKPLPCSARVFTPLRRERPPLLASAIGAALLFLSTPVLAAWTTVSLHASQRWRHHLLYHP